MSQNNVPLAELVAELRQLCQSGKTGKYVVTTVDNRFLTFGLQDGRIVMINIGIKSGTDALKVITAVQGGNGTFMELAPHPGQMVLPEPVRTRDGGYRKSVARLLRDWEPDPRFAPQEFAPGENAGVEGCPDLGAHLGYVKRARRAESEIKRLESRKPLW